MTRSEFYAQLDAIRADPAQRVKREARIWKEASSDCAVLVSDLTGFTRTTQNKGIVHFLGVFREFTLQAEPILDQHRAVFKKMVADNIMAVFPDVPSAVNAARLLRDIVIHDVRCCIGISYGKIILLEDDAFGNDVNLAYKLGEDVARDGQILLSPSAAAKLDPGHIKGPFSTEISGLQIPYFELK
jgi:class 3 adenylate cyclase